MSEDEGYVMVVTDPPVEHTGTIVVYQGVSDDDETLWFVVDPETAAHIDISVAESGMALIGIEDWQVVEWDVTDVTTSSVESSDPPYWHDDRGDS